MNFIIYFLLISGVSIITSDANSAQEVANNLQAYFDSNGKKLRIGGLNHLSLISEGGIGYTDTAWIWKGMFRYEIPVSVKIIWDEDSFKIEDRAMEKLTEKGTNDIEQFGVPKIYYHGKIIIASGKYNCIVMTLFDGTLEEYYKNHKSPGSSGSSDSPGKLPDPMILEIFRQTVITLQFLNSKGVVHNDIRPQNIFIRVINDQLRFYIGGYDAATVNGRQNQFATVEYASSNYYNRILHPFSGHARTAMDDLESLCYTMWRVSGIPLGKWRFIPEGCLMSTYNKKEKAKKRVMEKLKTLQNDHVREVFKFICVDEMLSEKPAPDYGSIIQKLHEAIVNVSNNHM